MSEDTPKSQLVWDMDSQEPDLAQTLRDGLREINDPEIHLNIIQLGLVRNVILEPERAIVKMILTTPFCPYGPSMLEATRQKAENILGREVHIDLGLEPWDFSMMEDGLGGEWGLF